MKTSLYPLSLIFCLLLACHLPKRNNTEQVWNEINGQLISFNDEHFQGEQLDSMEREMLLGGVYIDTVLRPLLNADTIPDYFVVILVDPLFSLYMGYFFDGSNGQHLSSAAEPFARHYIMCREIDVLCQEKKTGILLSRSISTYGHSHELYRYNEANQQVEMIFSLTYPFGAEIDGSAHNQSNLLTVSNACIDTIYTYYQAPAQDKPPAIETESLPKQTYVFDHETQTFIKD